MGTLENNPAAGSNELAAALAAEQISLPPATIECLDRYRRLLWEWNERLNLTRHTTLEKFVSRDLVDSDRLADLLPRGARVLDVGTGGGVPGVILSILRPDLSVSLCESTQKKARAVESIVSELGLATPVYATRAEDLLKIETFDVLVARALAALPKVLGFLAPYWDAFDELLLIKGPSWVDEWTEARGLNLLRKLAVEPAASYRTALTGAESVIVRVRPATKRA